MKTKKAQIEFAAIIGIVAVLLVVAYYALSNQTIFSSPVPTDVGQEQNLIKDSVITEGKAGADIGIKWIEQQGGYIVQDTENAVGFNKLAVSYWQKCGQTTNPTLTQITERLEGFVKAYINNSLYEKDSYFGKNTSINLNMMTVTANILDNKVDFSVNVPATVSGYAVQQPFTFSIPTKLGEIYKFGSAFVADNAQKRMLEQFTISSIYFSGEIETQGILTQCGDGIYQSGRQISDGLENAIKYTLANIVWWRPMPVDNSKSKTYSIESVGAAGGKTYPQLDIGFYLPDKFRLGDSTPLSVTNNKFIVTSPFFVIPVCVAVYDWKYSTIYPAVVRVKDSLTGNDFNFAVLVDVDKMAPGDCAGVTAGAAGAVMNCTADIRVVGSNGQPVEGASATFADVFVGRSDSNGAIRGPVACGSYALTLQKEGYGLFTTGNTTQINKTYALKKLPTIGVNFYSVDIEKSYDILGILEFTRCQIKPTTGLVSMTFNSTEGQYGISNVDTSTSPAHDCDTSPNCLLCRQTSSKDACTACISDCTSGLGYVNSVNISYLPPGSYAVDTIVIDRTSMQMEGGFKTNYVITEANTTLNTYSLIGEGDSYLPDQRQALTEKLRNECGMAPIKTSAQRSLLKMASCSCDNLKRAVDSTPSLQLCLGSSIDLSSSCSKAAVKAAINACGFDVTGC